MSANPPVLPILPFEIAPEVRWTAEHALQLPRDFGSDPRFSLYDLVDSLLRKPPSFA